jgi:ligand-binding SRPBCC domain-containing protein
MITLCADTVIYAPAARCFDLARSIKFHAASAGIIHGKAMAGRTAGLAALGDKTTWSARFFGLRFSLTTEITEFDRPTHFSDMMCIGLFTYFGHRYTFEPISPKQTRMRDEFSFQSPFGFLGSAFDNLVLRRRMQIVMDVRALALKRVAESDEWQEYLRNAEEQEVTP